MTPRDLQQLMGDLEASARREPGLKLLVHIPDSDARMEPTVRMTRELLVDQAQRRGELSCPDCGRPSLGYDDAQGWTARRCEQCAPPPATNGGTVAEPTAPPELPRRTDSARLGPAPRSWHPHRQACRPARGPASRGRRPCRQARMSRPCICDCRHPSGHRSSRTRPRSAQLRLRQALLRRPARPTGSRRGLRRRHAFVCGSRVGRPRTRAGRRSRSWGRSCARSELTTSAPAPLRPHQLQPLPLSLLLLLLLRTVASSA